MIAREALLAYLVDQGVRQADDPPEVWFSDPWYRYLIGGRRVPVFPLLLLLLVLGCASGPIGSLLPIEPGQQIGEVFVVRDTNIVGSPNSYYIILDGRDIFAIRVGQYTKFKIARGEHYIGVKCFGGWSPTWKKYSVGFNLAPGGQAYFVISPNLSCAEINHIDRVEGERRISESKHVEMPQ